MVLQLTTLAEVQVTGIPKDIKGCAWDNYVFFSID